MEERKTEEVIVVKKRRWWLLAIIVVIVVVAAISASLYFRNQVVAPTMKIHKIPAAPATTADINKEAAKIESELARAKAEEIAIKASEFEAKASELESENNAALARKANTAEAEALLAEAKIRLAAAKTAKAERDRTKLTAAEERLTKAKGETKKVVVPGSPESSLLSAIGIDPAELKDKTALQAAQIIAARLPQLVNELKNNKKTLNNPMTAAELNAFLRKSGRASGQRNSIGAMLKELGYVDDDIVEVLRRIELPPSIEELRMLDALREQGWSRKTAEQVAAEQKLVMAPEFLGEIELFVDPSSKEGYRFRATSSSGEFIVLGWGQLDEATRQFHAGYNGRQYVAQIRELIDPLSGQMRYSGSLYELQRDPVVYTAKTPEELRRATAATFGDGFQNSGDQPVSNIKSLFNKARGTEDPQ